MWQTGSTFPSKAWFNGYICSISYQTEEYRQRQIWEGNIRYLSVFCFGLQAPLKKKIFIPNSVVVILNRGCPKGDRRPKNEVATCAETQGDKQRQHICQQDKKALLVCVFAVQAAPIPFSDFFFGTLYFEGMWNCSLINFNLHSDMRRHASVHSTCQHS